MKAVVLVLACLAVQIFAQSYPGNIAINSQTADGFDTVFLDTPSWVTALQRSFMDHQWVIYGDGVPRMIADEPTFQALQSMTGPAWPSNLKFQTVEFFNDTGGSTWAVGTLTTPLAGPVQPNGYELLVAIAGGPQSMAPVVVSLGNHAGFIPTAIRVEPVPQPNVTVYFIGYMGNETGNGVTWGIVRTNVNLNLLGTQGYLPFTYNPEFDVSTPTSMPFNIDENNQNYVYHDHNLSALFLLDNYADVIYKYTLPFVNQSLTSVVPVSFPLSAWTSGFVVVSMDYDYGGQNFYVGLAATGQGTGAVLVVSSLNGAQVGTITLPTNTSNPKAISVDPWNRTLIIAPNGGPSVLKYDISQTATPALPVGYQALPFYLHRVWLGQDSHQHVYFSTFEQHSKIFRISKADFCPNQACSTWGFCSAGKCQCNDWTQLFEGVCQPKTYVKEVLLEKRVHGGETALGILFMFAVIIAAGGWYMFWRARRAGASYQPVL